MSSVHQYLRERFPLQAVVPLCFATAAWLVGITAVDGVFSNSVIVTVLVAIGFLSFLLRQRVTDEFKDHKHDSANYPNRPVQRGLISRRTLALIGAISLLIELGCVLSVCLLAGNPAAIGVYSLVLLFSALTAAEFFIPSWLERHFNVYFISHQLIFVCFSIWAIAVFSTPFNGPIFAGLSAFVLVMASVEVIRKFEIRLDPNGDEVRDTYLTVWGRPTTIAVLIAIALLNGVLLWSWSAHIWFVFLGLAVSIALLALKKSNSAIQATVVLSFITHGFAVWAS